MTQEERQLLLQDLTARIPYGLKGQCEFVTENDYEFWSESNRFNLDVNLEKISKDGKIRVQSFFDDTIDKESEEGAKQLNLLDFVEDYQDCADDEIDIEDFKPYLRPLSAMTDDEREYVNELSQFKCTPDKAMQKIDFYNSHFLDYRCLIKKGLALEAPEGIYTKN